MRYYKYSMNMTVLNVFSVCLFIPFYIIILGLGYGEYVNFSCLILYFLWMFLHEFLHGIGFSFSVSKHKNMFMVLIWKRVFFIVCVRN